MKGLFDTAKNMAVFIRVLLLTFALQCVFGAVGYAQENPTGGDQGAPSCSSGECTSGDSCQCLTTHVLNNDGGDSPEAPDDSDPSRDEGDQYRIEPVDKIRDLLDRAAAGLIGYMSVHSFDTSPLDLLAQELDRLDSGDRWLTEYLIRTGQTTNNSLFGPPWIISAQYHPRQRADGTFQGKGVYEPRIISSMKRLQFAFTVTMNSRQFVDGDAKETRDVYVLDWDTKYCYYLGWYGQPGMGGGRPGVSEETPNLRLYNCLPASLAKGKSQREVFQYLRIAENQFALDINMLMFDTVVSITPILGTAEIIPRRLEDLCKGDPDAWSEVGLSLVAEWPICKGGKLVAGYRKLDSVVALLNKSRKATILTTGLIHGTSLLLGTYALITDEDKDGFDAALLGLDAIGFVIGQKTLRDRIRKHITVKNLSRALPSSYLGCRFQSRCLSNKDIFTENLLPIYRWLVKPIETGLYALRNLRQPTKERIKTVVSELKRQTVKLDKFGRFINLTGSVAAVRVVRYFHQDALKQFFQGGKVVDGFTKSVELAKFTEEVSQLLPADSCDNNGVAAETWIELEISPGDQEEEFSSVIRILYNIKSHATVFLGEANT